jgi:hypothetical protein
MECFGEISWYRGNEIAGSIKDAEFVNNWSGCWCLNKDSAADNKFMNE